VDHCTVPVSQSAHHNIFCTQFNLGFGSLRSDTCSKCESADIGNSTDGIDQHKQLSGSYI